MPEDGGLTQDLKALTKVAFGVFDSFDCISFYFIFFVQGLINRNIENTEPKDQNVNRPNLVTKALKL